jgi:glycosyl hydrolase family 114
VKRVSAALLSLVLVAGCAESEPDPGPATTAAPTSAPAAGVRLPEPDMVFDYQLGGPYAPPDQVRAVARDRTAAPLPGRYNICYVNAFQTQPGEAVTWWTTNHPDLLLRDGGGGLVIDKDWQEPLLDISTDSRRSALMEVVGPWIDGCADAGFDAVEPDNLDSYQRSGGGLTADHAAAFAAMLTGRAHRRNLAVAQKNTTDLLSRRAETGFDFAVVEECARFDECGEFAETYQDRMFDVEYEPQDFTQACQSWGGRLSITLRDREVLPAGTPGHHYDHC